MKRKATAALALKAPNTETREAIAQVDEMVGWSATSRAPMRHYDAMMPWVRCSCSAAGSPAFLARAAPTLLVEDYGRRPGSVIFPLGHVGRLPYHSTRLALPQAMYTLLHLSDLHRATGEEVITNAELLDSLLNDRDTYGSDHPPIPQPDIIVVSGDVVRGVPLGDPDYPASLIEQYDEAYAFLIDLSEQFVDGDRSRVILAPGNHDIDWNATRRFMNVDDSDPDPRPFLASADSLYRWSWPERRLYRVVDHGAYEAAKLKHFVDMCRRFYENAPLRFAVDPARYWNLFDIDGRVGIVAFNSCRHNDCFSSLGDIPSAAIAEASLELRTIGDLYDLKIAVWHHSVGGSHLRPDYIDPTAIMQLIPRGYRLGLHGHQHMPGAAPLTLSEGHEEESIAIVAAGSLCADSTNLPRGVGRQYNVIELNPDVSGARVHLRETTVPGANIFQRGRMPGRGSASHVDLHWRPPVKQAMNSNSRIRTVVERAERLFHAGDFQSVIELLRGQIDDLPAHGRFVLNAALERAPDADTVIKVLSNPRTAGEVTLVSRAYAQLGLWADAHKAVERAREEGTLDPVSIQELKLWIDRERRVTS